MDVGSKIWKTWPTHYNARLGNEFINFTLGAESNLTFHYFPEIPWLWCFCSPVLSAAIEGLVQENPDSACRLGLEKMINPQEWKGSVYVQM